MSSEYGKSYGLGIRYGVARDLAGEFYAYADVADVADTLQLDVFASDMNYNDAVTLSRKLNLLASQGLDKVSEAQRQMEAIERFVDKYKYGVDGTNWLVYEFSDGSRLIERSDKRHPELHGEATIRAIFSRKRDAVRFALESVAEDLDDAEWKLAEDALTSAATAQSFNKVVDAASGVLPWE